MGYARDGAIAVADLAFAPRARRSVLRLADTYVMPMQKGVGMSESAQGSGPAVASGSAVGHGTIRLRTSEPPSPSPEADSGAAAAAVDVAHGPVGHGTIRLRADQPAAATAEPATAEPAPAGVPAPGTEGAVVGHGPIRFVDRALQLDPAATDAAEAEIFAVLSAAS